MPISTFSKRWLHRLACLSMAGLSACATHPVATAEHDSSPWGQRVEAIWLARTQQSLQHFDATLAKYDQPKLKNAQSFRLVSQAPQSSTDWLITSPDGSQVTLILDNQSGEDTLYNRAVFYPVFSQTLRYADQLSSGHTGNTPAWLRWGAAQWLAVQIMDDLHASSASRDWLTNNSNYIRKDMRAINFRGFTNTGLQAEGTLQISGWMITQLQAKTGEHFLPAWFDYYRQAAKPDFDAYATFEKIFGISYDEFIDSLPEKLAETRAELRTHAHAAPASSGYAELTDLQRFPLQGNEYAIKAFQHYQSARSPKAFAISPRGTWGFEEDASDAMDRAMTVCRIYDSTACQLYAVDNDVVYLAPSEDHPGHIDVILISSDPRAQKAGASWVASVEALAAAFNTYTHEHIGRSLSLPSRIYLASSRTDYTRTLEEKLQNLPSEARFLGEVSSGLADQLGQIALIVPAGPVLENEDTYLPGLTEITLHEMTHELQGQLSHRYAGFTVPSWLAEGSADLLAARIAGQLPGDNALFRQGEWEKRQFQAYRLGITADPETILKIQEDGWKKMGLTESDGAHYQTATLMALCLEARLGDQFYAALRDYLIAAGEPGQTHAAAFEHYFGMSDADFLSYFKTWIKTAAQPT